MRNLYQLVVRNHFDTVRLPEVYPTEELAEKAATNYIELRADEDDIVSVESLVLHDNVDDLKVYTVRCEVLAYGWRKAVGQVKDITKVKDSVAFEVKVSETDPYRALEKAKQQVYESKTYRDRFCHSNYYKVDIKLRDTEYSLKWEPYDYTQDLGYYIQEDSEWV